LGRLTESADDAQRAHGIARTLGIANYLSGSATRRASIAAARGNYNRAYALSMEAGEMTAKAARERAGPRVVELINRYESQSKQHRIDELTRHNQVQAAQLSQRELQQRWLWTVLAGVIAALAVVGVLVIRQRRSQRQLEVLNAQLQRSESNIRCLNADLERRVQVRTAEARQQAHYLRTLIDMLPMWAWFKDTRSRYLVVNQAHAAARGHSVAAMEGRSDVELLPAGVAQQQLSDDEEVMDSRERKTTEERVANDDSSVWMETYKAAVLDDDGTVLGMVGVARNISERKAAEVAREEALSEARKLAYQRSQFLAHMSHELRSPLNSIMGFAQILQRDKTLNERQGKAIRMIDESGRHLLTLINDVLDLARIDAGKLELVPCDTHLTTFLRAICGAIQVRADGKDLVFALEVAPDLPPMIRVDEKRLRQVLLNLLSNAVKFTDSGRVTLRARRLVPSAAESAAANVARLRFEVEDEGIGMSEAQQSRLFQPFEQVGDTRRREGGTGLGLAISRQLIQLMGGEIRVRSRLGAGSVFAFEIEVPQSQGRSENRLPQNVPIGYPGERRRILVADDVPQNRAMLVEALGGLGFEMAEAENGREALQAVAKLRPHLVVIDLAMPVMDGFEAMRRLRQLPAGADLPIIATSASATAETEAASSAAGANAFISKPIQEATLLRVIAALLRVDWICDPTATLAGES
jgi:PAS domain S-box-containing protein